jgi:hypothetical protein
MYPAEQVLNGTISANNLPDSIKVYNGGLGFNGVIANKNGVGYYLARGDGYNIEARMHNGNPEWRIYPLNQADDSTELNVETPGCLIGIWPVEGEAAEDRFANSYTLTYTSDITCESVSATVTRESLCIWRGIADDGTVITLEIEFGSYSDLYAWITNAPNCGGNRIGVGTPFDRNAERGRLNTPIGNFEDEITPGAIIHTVS